MEVMPQQGNRYTRNSVVPCSYSDYQVATRGEVPERYINTLSKLL
jgi:formiminoglutamase